MAQGNDLKFQHLPATESAGKGGNDITHEREHAGTPRPPPPKLQTFVAFRVFSRHSELESPWIVGR
jgi:hypothetical protein